MTQTDIDYEGRVFRSISNSPGGDVGDTTTFEYHQAGDVVWATYRGGEVLFGTLVAQVDARGHLDMRYQHLTANRVFKTGRGDSKPELLPDGRLRLHETWRWTSGQEGTGRSVVEEVV